MGVIWYKIWFDLWHNKTRTLLAVLPFKVAGASEDEQLDTLRKRIGEYVYDQLIAASHRINLVSPEEIAATAASFRPLRANGARSDADLASDAEAVAGPAPE